MSSQEDVTFNVPVVLRLTAEVVAAQTVWGEVPSGVEPMGPMVPSGVRDRLRDRLGRGRIHTARARGGVEPMGRLDRRLRTCDEP